MWILRNRVWIRRPHSDCEWSSSTPQARVGEQLYYQAPDGQSNPGSVGGFAHRGKCYACLCRSPWVEADRLKKKDLYLYLYLSLYIYLPARMPACQRLSDPILDGCKLPCGCWVLNSGPLEKQDSAINCWATSPATDLFLTLLCLLWYTVVCGNVFIWRLIILHFTGFIFETGLFSV